MSAYHELAFTSPQWLRYGIRSVSMVMAMWTSVFSLVSVKRTFHPYQQARFIGLGTLALIFTGSTMWELDSPLKISTLLYAVAWGISVYGNFGYLKKPEPKK
jgi:hypothetical protein